jgi:DNA topoisomerase IA
VTVIVEGEPFDAKGYRILFEGWRKYYPYWRATEVLQVPVLPGLADQGEDDKSISGSGLPGLRALCASRRFL